MPIRDLMRYDLPERFKLEKEGDILNLLRDVRESINNLEYNFETCELRKVLETIECRRHIIKAWATRDTEIDLSIALEVVESYKEKSGQGCHSCEYKEGFKSLPDETYVYCSLSESKSDVDEKQGCSPRIKRYREKGCDDRKRIFRPIEEVLEEAGY